MNLSFWKVIETGGVAMWVIIALSVLAIAVACERLALLWRFMDRARTLADTVTRCLGPRALVAARGGPPAGPGPTCCWWGARAGAARPTSRPGGPSPAPASASTST